MASSARSAQSYTEQEHILGAHLVIGRAASGRSSSSSSWLPRLPRLPPLPPMPPLPPLPLLPSMPPRPPRPPMPQLLPSLSHQQSSSPSRLSSPTSSSSAFSTPSQRRRRRSLSHGSNSSRHAHSRRRESALQVPSEWGDDTADELQLATPAGSSVHDSTSDDHFLSALIDNDFSSPSTYSPAHQIPQPSSQSLHVAFATAAAPRRPSSRSPSLSPSPSPSPLRYTNRLSLSSVGDSQDSLITRDLGFEELLSSVSTQSSFVEMPPPPPPPRLQDILNAPDPAPAAKRQRVSGTQKGPAHSKPLPVPRPSNYDDIFGEDEGFDEDAALEALTPIDLTEVNEVPEGLKEPEVDNRVKLANFQCVICMDDVVTLTVTHCGHLYCQKCLHSSLHNAEIHKGRCPMCRAKIDMKPRPSYSIKTKGYWPLELKLMTVTKQGKRKANAMS